jgi:hypothetical protein
MWTRLAQTVTVTAGVADDVAVRAAGDVKIRKTPTDWLSVFLSH